MLTSGYFSRLKTAAVASLLAAAACTPTYDWREIRGTETSFTVMLPSKPSTHTRPVNLNGTQVTMVMTAAEANGAIFAIGTAELADAAAAQSALTAMKTAMVNNINGRITQEKTSARATASGNATSEVTTIDIEAVGTPPAGGNGQPQLLVGRFIAQDRKVYQAIVVGKEKSISRDAVDTFLSSFKPN